MAITRKYDYLSISDDIDTTFTFRHNSVRDYSLSEVSYKLNSFGFRSDEFTANHNEDHVLFIGCSVTYGTGVPLEKMWSKLLYDKLRETRPLSGYFNLSYPGAASTEIIFNAMKYIKKYGAPKEIYFMLPEMMRGIHVEKSSAILHSVQMYMMFEEFCASKGIKLTSFTWDLDDISGGYIQTANDFYEQFKTFHRIEYKAFLKSMYEYSSKSTEPFLLLAADGQHHGTAHNYAFYKTISEMIGETNGL
jgi:hypothetical protein